ncbi:MAG: gamma carbonic anhydrase family protein [Spirochaetales bacterium]|nr:gamma carbonic anhydrase family protein [Spirochaetales bacterium]MCF7939942.1 gamma carbonic anhydrase family protein [Spirochaetales bacterium]
MIGNYRNKRPVFQGSAWVAWNAHVSGDVSIGDDVSFWFSTSARGDMERIEVGRGSNIQDNAVLHVSAGFPCIVGEDVTIGHGAVVHACTVGNRCLIGMGAVVLDGAEIGEDSIVGAGALVTGGKRFPPRSLILGSPAEVKKTIPESGLERILENARHYVELAEVTSRDDPESLPRIQKETGQ